MEDNHEVTDTSEKIMQELCERYKTALKTDSSPAIKLTDMWQESFSLLEREYFEQVLKALSEVNFVQVSFPDDTLHLTERGIKHCERIGITS